MSLTIEVDSQKVQAVLAKLGASIDDMTPTMRQISGVLADGIEQAFADERDPVTGTPWQKLSNVTIAIRAAAGHWPGKKLQVSGHLATSIVPQFGRDYAMAGTNVTYAHVQQEGASKGAFGKTSRGAPIPWGDIPPRPFVGFSDADEQEVLDIVYKRLAAALK